MLYTFIKNKMKALKYSKCMSLSDEICVKVYKY